MVRLLTMPSTRRLTPELEESHGPVHRGCYVAFLLTTVYAVGFVSRVAVPNTIDTGTIAPTVEASAFNLLPIGVFAIQHSGMARKQFKQWWTHFVPTAVERSTCIVLKLGTRLPVLAMASNAGPGMADRRSPDRHGGNGACRVLAG
jgi:hypothetical protein